MLCTNRTSLENDVSRISIHGPCDERIGDTNLVKRRIHGTQNMQIVGSPLMKVVLVSCRYLYVTLTTSSDASFVAGRRTIAELASRLIYTVRTHPTCRI